ncbi:hypothetical protein D3874_09200 [Oleomonas cavernae]|uniref:Phage tail lysozyme domain-containing protein n=2 Tax=Oleomonas cavernae TaxID=2320859 RepID=A0A418WAW5_9PROT|nr:hypothetical protein D3874_09200 [Oleomonas cavernae]
MHNLMADFELNQVQAAGVLGNIGHECNGFRNLHEIGQPEGKGGYGWAQWTGPRRKSFFAWCDKNALDWKTDFANYGYLKHELVHEYKSTISAVLKTKALGDAVAAFEKNFEKAGTPNYKSREAWGQEALDAFNAAAKD